MHEPPNARPQLGEKRSNALPRTPHQESERGERGGGGKVLRLCAVRCVRVLVAGFMESSRIDMGGNLRGWCIRFATPHALAVGNHQNQGARKRPTISTFAPLGKIRKLETFQRSQACCPTLPSWAYDLTSARGSQFPFWYADEAPGRLVISCALSFHPLIKNLGHNDPVRLVHDSSVLERLQ